MFQFLYNIGNLLNDSGTWLAIIGVSSYVLARLRRIERALHMVGRDYPNVAAVRERVIGEVSR